MTDYYAIFKNRVMVAGTIDLHKEHARQQACINLGRTWPELKQDGYRAAKIVIAGGKERK